MDERLRRSDRAADARARLYAAEIRARLATFAADQLTSTGLEVLLDDLRGICNRMDGTDDAPATISLAGVAKVFDLRRTRLTDADFDNLLMFPQPPAAS